MMQCAPITVYWPFSLVVRGYVRKSESQSKSDLYQNIEKVALQHC